MLDDYEVRVDVFDMAGQPFFYDVSSVCLFVTAKLLPM